MTLTSRFWSYLAKLLQLSPRPSTNNFSIAPGGCGLNPGSRSEVTRCAGWMPNEA